MLMKHLINFENYTAEMITEIIDKAIKIKDNPGKYADILYRKKLYMLFQKTSTRTALSFSMGMSDLGGSFFSQNWQDSNFAIADICDEVRYASKNVDIIMARLKENEDIETMAKYSTVPVINGCCNKFHPCQALADIMTIKERFGCYNIKLLYIGVHNNVLNSLMETLPALGGNLYALTPIINDPSKDERVYEQAKNTGRFHIINPSISNCDLKSLIKDMDVVYTDSWIDMEFFNDESYHKTKEERIKIMNPFQLNNELMDGSGAIVMHDMPIHCGYEIDRDIVEKNIDVIMQQSENRRHAQNGVLVTLLSENVQ